MSIPSRLPPEGDIVEVTDSDGEKYVRTIRLVTDEWIMTYQRAPHELNKWKLEWYGDETLGWTFTELKPVQMTLPEKIFALAGLSNNANARIFIDYNSEGKVSEIQVTTGDHEFMWLTDDQIANL